MKQVQIIRNAEGNIICKIHFVGNTEIPVISIVGKGCATDIYILPDRNVKVIYC